MQSVWNRGKSTTSAPPSNIPKLASAQTEVVHGQVPASKEEHGKTRLAPPSFVPNRKATIAPAKSTAVTATGNKAPASFKPPVAQTQGSLVSRASRSRSPLPSFSPSTSNSSTASGKTRSNRANSILGTGKSRTSAGVSSVGTRLRNSNAVPDNIGSMGSKEPIGRYSTKSAAGSMISTRTTARASSSRLLAPTASSLAKTLPQSINSATTTGDAGSDGKRKAALGSITNSHIVNGASSSHGNKKLLPGQTDVFSNDSSELGEDLSSKHVLPVTTGPLKRTLSGRKPRISRSKVIAKLASQRAVSGSSVSSIRSSSSGVSVLKPRIAHSSGRTRSSIGVKVARASYGSGRSSSGGNGLALAIGMKRAARRSEYSRRRSSRVTQTEGAL